MSDRDVYDAAVYSGYWFRDKSSIPKTKPGHAPTGALLLGLKQGFPATSRKTVTCLNMIEIGDDGWYPLSEAVLFTYSHTADLTLGHKWIFLPANEPWNKAVYQISSGRLISRKEVGRLFGMKAMRRARHDRKTLLLHLRRVAQQTPTETSQMTYTRYSSHWNGTLAELTLRLPARMLRGALAKNCTEEDFLLAQICGERWEQQWWINEAGPLRR